MGISQNPIQDVEPVLKAVEDKAAAVIADKLAKIPDEFQDNRGSHLKPFSKADGRPYKVPADHRQVMGKERVSLPWLEVRTVTRKQTLGSRFKCANSKVKTMSTVVDDDGSMLTEVNCDLGFAKVFATTGNGEAQYTNFYDLKTCSNLGSGDNQSFSQDKRFMVITTDAGGFETNWPEAAILVALECESGFCHRLTEKKFGRETFGPMKWPQPLRLQFVRNPIEPEQGEQVSILNRDDKKKVTVTCTLDLSSKPKLNCR